LHRRDLVGVHGDAIVADHMPEVVDPLLGEEALGVLEDEVVIA
jgi:hypothetical protein